MENVNQLLEETATYWEKISKNEGIYKINFGDKLCQAFVENNCENCPVKLKTTYEGCGFTHRLAFEKHQLAIHKVDDNKCSHVMCDKCATFAKKHSIFLRSLINEEQPQPTS